MATGPFRGRSTNQPAQPIQRQRSLSPETFDDISTVDSDTDAPPVIQSPIKRKARSAALVINKQSDIEVWALTDIAIINAAQKTWRSDSYTHYDVTLKREFNGAGSPVSLTYVFTCKSRPDKHNALLRPRSRTSEGTSNLVKTMHTCLVAQGLVPGDESAPSSHGGPVGNYSSAGHRALIALRCAKNARPFNAVADEDYRLEVAMLRPNTILPSPQTVGRDINTIYLELSCHVSAYFKKLNTPYHLIVDGWSSPLVYGFEGLVIAWYENGQMHRAILEFIRLTQKHDGDYLASVIGDCLKRFGIAEQLFSICMDNATNCDKLAELLPNYLPGNTRFTGEQGRLRCTAHIFNLIAKASFLRDIFISFFFKKPKAKKTLRIGAGARPGGFRGRGEQHNVGEEEEVVLDSGDASDEDSGSDEDNTAIQEEADESIAAAEDDEGQVVHNDRVAKTLNQKAINMMAAKGIFMLPAEARMALQIFPRVSGLARRVHDSPTLKERFDRLVSNDPALEGSRRALSRRVPTRWNSDLECLRAHFHFRDIVEQLTATPSLGLASYRLSDDMWEMAEDVQEILLLFDEATKVFSTAEVPLIVDVIPTLEELREGLIAARDDQDNGVSTVVQVACQAGLLLIEKYST